jgi:hypothetical protein
VGHGYDRGDSVPEDPGPLQRRSDGAIGETFSGRVVSDRISVEYNIPVEDRQLCWHQLKRDLVTIPAG